MLTWATLHIAACSSTTHVRAPGAQTLQLLQILHATGMTVQNHGKNKSIYSPKSAKGAAVSASPKQSGPSTNCLIDKAQLPN